MNINLEAADKHAIQSYDNTQVKINSVIYTTSFIVNKESIYADWVVTSIDDLNETSVQTFLTLTPELIIIGHTQLGKFAPASVMAFLNSQGIGFECMAIGSACRTYNVLLSEHRNVALGIIIS